GVLVDRAFEPAVELAGRDALGPGLAYLEGGGEELVDALAGHARNGEERDAARLAQPLVQCALDAVEQAAGMLGYVPFVDRDDERPALLEDVVGDAQVLRLEATGAVKEEDDDLGEIDRAERVGDGELLELVLDLGLLAHARRVDEPHRAHGA